MAEPKPPPPAMLLLAAFSRDAEAIAWARRRAEAAWGPVGLESPAFEFTETDYYAATMGAGLLKTFWAFQRPFDPARLAAIKLATNAWEADYAALESAGVPRPLNLDPGYLTLAKLVLASTKDHAHRVYLADGIYAEVTLHYSHHRWQAREWTFADYRRADYHEFFSACRERLHRRVREGQGT